MSNTLYVSDLDGTLLGADSRLSPATVENLNRAIAAGAAFTVASARTPATASGILADVDMNVPAVLMTGAALWDRESNSYSHTHFINPEVAAQMVEIYRAEHLPTFLYTLSDNKINIHHIGHLSDIERRFIDERRDSPFKTFNIPSDGDSQLPSPIENTLLLYAMRPTDDVERVFKRIRTLEGVNPIFYHDIFGPETGIMEVFSPEASKAAAVRELAEARGYDRIVAFGDNLNDLPLLRMADVAVAVENAVPEVKETADIIIGPNTSDSVSKFILDDFLSK